MCHRSTILPELGFESEKRPRENNLCPYANDTDSDLEPVKEVESEVYECCDVWMVHHGHDLIMAKLEVRLVI